MRMVVTGFIALLVATPAGAATSTVSVIPFAPRSGDLPEDAAQKISGALEAALGAHSSLAVHASPTRTPAPSSTPSLSDALARAQALLASGHPADAARILTEAIQAARAHPAPSLDVATLAAADAALSRAAYQSGDDDRGQAALASAIVLQPDLPFDEVRSSELFARIAHQTLAELSKKPRASLRLDSIPSGAPLRVDGVDVGSSPVLVRDLLPGPHLWRAELPGGPLSGIVELRAGEVGEALASSADPLVALFGGKAVPPEALAQLHASAEALHVEFLVTGAVHAEGRDLVLESFLYGASANRLARLPTVHLDSDLVGAVPALAPWAQEVAHRVEAGDPGPALALPAPLSALGPPAAAAELHFPPPGAARPARSDSAPRHVVGVRREGPIRIGP